MTALLPSLSHSTELATAIQRIQSDPFSDVVPNASAAFGPLGIHTGAARTAAAILPADGADLNSNRPGVT
jgi:hypothetical protein